MSETALYRHFDEAGTLLYVGIALSPIARLCDHRDGSAWYDRIATVRIVRYPTREEAAEAELRAIREERPLFNIAGAVAPIMVPANVPPRRAGRQAARLSALGVANANRPGYHCDGAGLYLLIANGGTKSWIFRYSLNKRRREMGLGGYPTVSLADARQSAHEQRRLLSKGIDPLEHRRAA